MKEKDQEQLKKPYIPEGIDELPPTFNTNSTHNFKSVRRAIRRGKLSNYGSKIPKRISNNRKPTAGRKIQEEMKKFKWTIEGKHPSQRNFNSLSYMEKLFKITWRKYYPDINPKF